VTALATKNSLKYYYRLLLQMAAQTKIQLYTPDRAHKRQNAKYAHKTDHKNRLQTKITVHVLVTKKSLCPQNVAINCCLNHQH